MSVVRIPYLPLLLIVIIVVHACAQQEHGPNVLAEGASVPSYIEMSKRFESDQPDSAVAYCNRALKMAEDHNDQQGMASVLLQMGHINSLHHHADLSRKFINEALYLFRTLRDKEGVARAYDELGLLDGSLNNMVAANADFSRSMQFYEDSHDSAGVASTYHGLGVTLEKKGDSEKALTYYLRALVLYEHCPQKPEDYFLLIERIGNLYARRGDRKTALHYLEEGVEKSNTPALKDTEVDILEEEGEIDETSGQSAGALIFYKKELEVAKTAGDFRGQVKALEGIAHVLRKDSAGKSLQYLNEALVIASDMKLPRLKANIYEALADVYRQQKHFKEAVAMQEEYSRLLDSVAIVSSRSEIAALDSSYALEAALDKVDELQEVNKVAENKINLGVVVLVVIGSAVACLWFYLRRARRLNRRLNESNEVKSKLISIIGHDLKGPAGNTVQVLDLLEKGTMPEEQRKKLLTELKKQSVASYELLTALFEWGKAQLHGVEVNPELFPTKPVIQMNISLLEQLAERKNISILDETPEDGQIYADPHHFDFVIRNLLSNAIKFTHEGGHITLRTQGEEGKPEIVYSVKDTGVGVSPEKQQAFSKTTLPVSFGTKGEKGSGLGLLLIKEFMRANKGRVWLESKVGEGTVFYCGWRRTA